MSNATAAPAPAFMDNPIILDLTNNYGAVLIGISLSSVVYGISSLQTFIYSLHCDNDPFFQKLLIAVLWAADTANQITLMVGAWPVLIKHYGSIAGLGQTSPALLHHIWVEHVVIVSVQLYFARRIWLFGHAGKASPGIRTAVSLFVGSIVLMVLFEIAAVVVYLSKGLGQPLAALSATTEIDIGTSLRATAFAVDVFLALGMLFLLIRSSPHFRGSKKMIQRLLVLTVASGSLTAAAAAVLVGLVQGFPTDLFYTIIEFPLCSLYLSTLLVNLNAREFVKNGARTENSSSFVGNTLGTNSTLVIRGINRTQDNDVFVQVDRETNIKLDELNSYGERTKV